MKPIFDTTLRRAITATLFVLALLFVPVLHAQPYSIDWSTIDGGGGTSTNGQYSLSGTIGQPDAGHLSGGSYSLDGGFWGAFVVVPTAGDPPLRIAVSGPNAVLLAWPSSSTGFSLQQNSALVTNNWSNVTNTVNVVGSENQVIISPAAGIRFYRLIQ